MSNGLGAAVVGCGLIGRKRASVLEPGQLLACADLNFDRAAKLSKEFGSEAFEDWKTAICHPGVNIVIVSTSNNALSEVAEFSIQKGRHVIVEKPAARNKKELSPLIRAAEEKGVCVRVGFNHRYHDAIRKAHDLASSGEIGPLMFIRGRYGHGGRVGYDKEWRADPTLSGGGEMIDQGVHLIDLSRWFLGDFSSVQGSAHTLFWDMPVDDNGFMLLKTSKQQVAFLQVSCTEWKNMFSLEIYGRDGKLQVDGLGGSYGVERLTHYKMLPEMGPPDTTIWEYPRGDTSWRAEFEEFLEDIRLNRRPEANLEDALAALDVVEQIYKVSGYGHYA
jgi:predicted dehydrogenase